MRFIDLKHTGLALMMLSAAQISLAEASSGNAADASSGNRAEAESKAFQFELGLGFQSGLGRIRYADNQDSADIQATVDGFIGISWHLHQHLSWRNRLGAFDVLSYDINIGESKSNASSNPPQYRGKYLQSGLITHWSEWSFGAGLQYQYGQKIVDDVEPVEIDPASGAFVSVALNRWKRLSVELEQRWLELESDDGNRISADSTGVHVIYRF